MTDTIKITYAARDEIFEIAAFLDACWKAEYRGIIAPDFLDDLSVDERYEKLLTRFNEGASTFLIMRNGERMIGASVCGKSLTEGYPEDGEYRLSICITTTSAKDMGTLCSQKLSGN